MLICVGIMGVALTGCKKASASNAKEEKKVENSDNKDKTDNKEESDGADENDTDTSGVLKDGTYTVSFKPEDLFE